MASLEDACITKFGRKYDYTYLLSVIMVSLKHAFMQVEDEHGRVNVFLQQSIVGGQNTDISEGHKALLC